MTPTIITMNETRRGCPDGFNVVSYEAGQSYTLDDDIDRHTANGFLRLGVATVTQKPSQEEVEAEFQAFRQSLRKPSAYSAGTTKGPAIVQRFTVNGEEFAIIQEPNGSFRWKTRNESCLAYDTAVEAQQNALQYMSYHAEIARHDLPNAATN